MEQSPLRIAFTGPESSGKTTLAKWCAQHFDLTYVEEYAREFLRDKKEYHFHDLDTMAKAQAALWPTLGFVADTEMHVFQVWSKFKYAKLSKTITELLKEQVFDHYFLCAPDIPWEEDPLRENPNNRQHLFELYRKELDALQRNYTILSGSLLQRQELIKIRVLELYNG